MRTLKRQIGLVFCLLAFFYFAQNTTAGAIDGGWPRDGYDLGYSYNYPYSTAAPIPDDPFEQDWSIGANGASRILTGDVNGDGYLEIVYTRGGTLYVLDGDGNELWSVMLGEGVGLDILDDVTGDGIEDIVCHAHVDKGRIMKLLFYDGAGNFLKEIADTIQYYPTWGVSTGARAVVDIDGDGDLEVVAYRATGYDCSYYPHLRGIEVFDYATGTKEWFYPIGPFPYPTICVADVTGDSDKEIIIGTEGPANGCCDNGFCDYHCYAICWDKDGNLLWSRQFEGSGFVDTEVSVGDLDGDGVNEVVCTSRKHGWGAWDGNIGRVYLLDPDNGTILNEYNVGKPVIVNGFADIVGDSVKEIVVNYKDGSTYTGKVLLFDNSLNLLDEYSVAGSRLWVTAINDLNGDGLSELLVRTLEWGSFAVLNADLDELWSLSYSSGVKNVIPSDMDNDGVNELLVSTVDSLLLLKVPFISVALDIKPQSCPNPLNVRAPGGRAKKSKAVLPAAILGMADFDVADIDPATVTLEGVPALRWNIEDVSTPVSDEAEECECNTEGADGHPDLTLKFDKSSIVEALGEVYDGDTIALTIAGELTDGTAIEGTDCVVIRGDSEPIPRAGHSGESSEVVLVGNYPNPFNPATEISFSLPSASHVKLEVFNVMGQKVATLVDGQFEAGEHVVRWDGSDAASGVYFYRLQAGDFVDTKKMMLLK